MNKKLGKTGLPVYQQIKRIVLADIFQKRCRTLSERKIMDFFHVSNTTARRVLNELAEDGYLKREVGKGTVIVNGYPGIVNLGIVFRDMLGTASSYVWGITRAVEKCAVQKECYLTLCTTRGKPISDSRRSPLFSMIARRRLDGILILSPLPIDDILFIQQSEIPFVVVNNEYPDFTLDIVVFDHYQAVYEAMERLSSSGYTKIALLCPPSGEKSGVLRGTTQASRAYVDFLKKRHAPFCPEMIIEGGESPEDGYSAMRKIASLPDDKRPQVVISMSARLATGAEQYLEENEKTKILLISYRIERDYPSPHIFADLQLLGETAFSLLWQHRLGDQPERILVPLQVKLSPDLVSRPLSPQTKEEEATTTR